MIKYAVLVFFLLLIEQQIFAQSCPRIDYHCDNGKFPVHLTFDDGPAPSTSTILDILRRERVKASFFVLGEKLIHPNGKKIAGSNYTLLDRMKNEGHIIGSHTYHHIHHLDHASKNRELKSSRQNELEMLKMSKMSWWKNLEITKNSQVLAPYLNHDGKKFFRLPYGQGWFEAERSSNRRTEVLGELLKPKNRETTPVHVGWNIDSEDWKPTDAIEFQKFIKKQVCDKSGGIILMHDHTQLTQQNLICVIRGLKDAGHRFVDTPNEIKELHHRTSGPRLVMAYDSIKGVHLPPEKHCQDQDSKDQIDRAEDQLQDLVDHLQKNNEYTPFAKRVHSQNIYQLRDSSGKMNYQHLITFSKFLSVSELAESKDLAQWANDNSINLGTLHFFKTPQGIQVGVER